MMSYSLVLALHFASCFFMTGVISLVQLIHYPCFAQIESSKFCAFHARHTQALGYIAGPAMVLELTTALWLARDGSFLFLVNGVSVLILWIITFLVSVPAHNQLKEGFQEPAWQRLVRTNWWRTLIWWVRSGALLVLMIQA